MPWLRVLNAYAAGNVAVVGAVAENADELCVVDVCTCCTGDVTVLPFVFQKLIFFFPRSEYKVIF